MITHVQATTLRAIKLGTVADCDGLTEDLYEFVLPGDDYGRDPGLSDSGELALAEYDAHHTIIERYELERLQALERKINVFLDGCYLAVDFSGAAGVLIDKGISIHMARYNEWDVHWPGGCCRALPSSGAMRKAFELFEVPGK